MVKKYVYNGEEYASVYAVRKAVFEAERKAFATPETEDEWAELGVTVVEILPELSELKARKLRLLDAVFMQWRGDGATLISSLGFTADADERAMIDVNGLVALGEGATFMDAENTPHELTAEELKTLQVEIIQSGNAAYQQKWALRTVIEASENEEQLNAVAIGFSPVDFSKV